MGAIDADKHRSFAKDYGVSGFPTIKIFTGRKHVPYKGARSADAFVDAALSAVKSKAYERLGKRSDDSSHKVQVLRSIDRLIKAFIEQDKENHNKNNNNL